MAKKNTQQPQEQFKTMIGGQALIEGIMMLGPEKSAVVVRTKDGLQRKVEPRKLSQKWSPKKLPFIRGIFNFCTSMKTGVSALMYSADFFAEEDEDEKGKEPAVLRPGWKSACPPRRRRTRSSRSPLCSDWRSPSRCSSCCRRCSARS